MVGELPVDAASGSRVPCTAQAAGRVARGRKPEVVEGSPRRRLVRRPLSAVIGRRKPALGRRGPGDPYASRNLGGIEEAFMTSQTLAEDNAGILDVEGARLGYRIEGRGQPCLVVGS